MVEKREGLKFVTELPEGVRCVSMVEFNGVVYVATECGVFKLVGDILEPIPFHIEEGGK